MIQIKAGACHSLHFVIVPVRGDASMPTDLEAIQAAIGTAWGVPASPELRKLSYGLLAASCRGVPEGWLREQLSRYLAAQYARTDEAACAAIAEALTGSSPQAA